MHIVWHKNLHACGCFSMCLHWKLPWGQHYTCCMSSWGVLWCGMCTKLAPSCLWRGPVEIHVCYCFLHHKLAAPPAFLPTLSAFLLYMIFLYSLSLSVDANMFLVVFFSFSTFLSVLYPFQIPEQCRVISQQCYAFINTNKQPYTNMFLPERALDTNCHTSCLVDTHANTHTHTERQQVSLSWNLPARGMWYCGKRPKGSRQ